MRLLNTTFFPAAFLFFYLSYFNPHVCNYARFSVFVRRTFWRAGRHRSGENKCWFLFIIYYFPHIPPWKTGSHLPVKWDLGVLFFASFFYFYFFWKSPFHRGAALVPLSVGEASCSIRRSRWSWKSRLLPGPKWDFTSFAAFSSPLTRNLSPLLAWCHVAPLPDIHQDRKSVV